MSAKSFRGVAMRVIVQLSSAARESLLRWQRHVAALPTGLIAKTIWDEILHELARSAGLPAGSRNVRETDPPEFEWMATSELVLRFPHLDRPSAIFRPAQQLVFVTSVQHIPRAGSPELPRR